VLPDKDRRASDDHWFARRHKVFYCALSGDEPVKRNLPPMPGVFPDYPAPVIRNAGVERELLMMRWGYPRPRAPSGTPATNIRNAALAGMAETRKPLSGRCQQLRWICTGAEPCD
jgi:putative SOS response-associated peptidase YedK